MIYFLLLCIISSTFLYVILKQFAFWKIETTHGIIINYYVATIFSFLMNPVQNYRLFSELENYWYISAFIGFLFITVFYIIAKTTQISGVTVASVASKMSMVIPITAGILIYNEGFTGSKVIGILLAIPAVVITAKPTVKTPDSHKLNLKTAALPILLFVGAGMVDTVIKMAQHFYINDENRNFFIMSIFGFAGIIGTFRLIYEIIILKKKLTINSILGGTLLGIVNYMALFFLVKCLAIPGSESSTIFAIVNIGVVLMSLVMGIILFKERINKLKVLGIVLAITAIVFLSIG